MAFDGQKQRNALTAAENTLRALARGDAARALANARRTSELDQLQIYVEFAAVVERLAGETPPTDEGWDALADALEPGPLRFLIDELRG